MLSLASASPFACFGLLCWAALRRFSLRARFGLSPILYAKWQGDLIGKPLALRCDGLAGRPDIVFRHRLSGHFVVGEFKAFSVSGPKLKAATYQGILYAGMIEKMGNGRVKEIRVLAGSRALSRKRYRVVDYQDILALKQELLRARLARR